MLRKLLTLARFSTHTREPIEPPYLELQRDFLDPAEFFQLLSQH